MPGPILLAGGAEFSGRMAEPDRRAIELAGGAATRLCIIPTAAAPDQNHQRAGANGARWFRSLGVRDVNVVLLLDRLSAADTTICAALRQSTLIYLLGGFTHYLGQTLLGSPAWEAILRANQSGAVIAGSSAGAMVLCEHYYDPNRARVEIGLGLVPGACVLPHHNTFGKRWAPSLVPMLPGHTLVGIDEQTGMIGNADSEWEVVGAGGVTLYRHGAATFYPDGATCRIDRALDIGSR